MSSHINSRRAPNVSQYLANLNSIPAAQEISPGNDFTLSDDLDFLTNTEFFDFDTFEQVGDFQSQAQTPLILPLGPPQTMNQPQFQFGEFQTYPSKVEHGLPTSPTNAIPNQIPHYVSAPNADLNESHKSIGLSGVPDFEEGARVAAEEDKRRRNTAASARFRVKKKQREQALEKQAKDMADKVQLLEGKVQQLEMENKWLKELITEKSEGKVVNLSGAPTSASTSKSSESTTAAETA